MKDGSKNAESELARVFRHLMESRLDGDSEDGIRAEFFIDLDEFEPNCRYREKGGDTVEKDSPYYFRKFTTESQKFDSITSQRKVSSMS
jgi:hypothetical protein